MSNMPSGTPPSPPPASGGGEIIYPQQPPKDPILILVLNLLVGGCVGYFMIGQKFKAIIALVLTGKTTQSEGPLVTSARHQESLRRAAEHISASLLTLQQGVPLDFVSIDLRAAYDALGEVTGETASEDLLERIFSEFCIGK